MHPADLAWTMLMLVLLVALSALWVYGYERIVAGAAAGEIAVQWGAAVGVAALSKLASLWRTIGPDGRVDDRALGRSAAMLVVGALLAVASFAAGLILLWARGHVSVLGLGVSTVLAAWTGMGFFVLANLPGLDRVRRSSGS